MDDVGAEPVGGTEDRQRPVDRRYPRCPPVADRRPDQEGQEEVPVRAALGERGIGDVGDLLDVAARHRHPYWLPPIVRVLPFSIFPLLNMPPFFPSFIGL